MIWVTVATLQLSKFQRNFGNNDREIVNSKGAELMLRAF